jgi:hypothetical protein
MMRVYVATAFPNKATASLWMGRLREVGIGITHDWTAVEAPPGPHGETALPIKEQQHHAILDMRGVMDANLVWIIAPETGGTGCWFEMGVAAGLQLASLWHGAGRRPPQVFVSGPRRSIFTSVFRHFERHEDAFEAIKAETEKDLADFFTQPIARVLGLAP